MPCETISLAVNRYRTRDDKPACSDGGAGCEFLTTAGMMSTAACAWGRGLVYLSTDKGRIVPHNDCPMWRR